jgi:nucleotide-binding universal stress UspA family protein
VLSQDGTFASKLSTENAMYQKILLAYDGSTESQQALLNCKDLSHWEHAKVHLLSVMPYDITAMGHESAFVIEKISNLKRIAF